MKVFCKIKKKKKERNKINEHESETLFILSIVMSLITEMTHKDILVTSLNRNEIIFLSLRENVVKWKMGEKHFLLASSKATAIELIFIIKSIGVHSIFIDTFLSLNCFVSLHHQRVSLNRVVMSRPFDE